MGGVLPSRFLFYDPSTLCANHANRSKTVPNAQNRQKEQTAQKAQTAESACSFLHWGPISAEITASCSVPALSETLNSLPPTKNCTFFFFLIHSYYSSHYKPKTMSRSRDTTLASFCLDKSSSTRTSPLEFLGDGQNAA